MTSAVAVSLDDLSGAIRDITRRADLLRIEIWQGDAFDPDETNGVIELSCEGCVDPADTFQRWQQAVGEEIWSARITPVNGSKRLAVELDDDDVPLELLADDIATKKRPYTVADLRRASDLQRQWVERMLGLWADGRSRLEAAQNLMREEIRRAERKSVFLRKLRPDRAAEYRRTQALLRRILKVLSSPDE